MVIHISKSPEETRRFAATLGASASTGRVIGLIGDLGAGKTEFVKGFAEGLGITERIHSPTFTLVNEYRSGRLPLYHLDLYRLEHEDQVRAAGLEIYLPPADGISLVEWFDRITSNPGIADLHIVRIAARSESEREIGYEDTRT